MSTPELSRYAAALAVSICLAGLCTADEGLSMKWSYDAGTRVGPIAAGDVYGDNVSEIVYAYPGGIRVLDASGRLLKSFPLVFNATSISIADVDGDGRNEILLGSGRVNETDVNGSRFDFKDLDKAREKEEFLYRIMRSQGDVYLLEADAKEPVRTYAVGEWIRDVFAGDVDGDGGSEVVTASGGSGINYVELVTTGINNETGNLTYIRNRTERYMQNGTVSIFFSNGSLKGRYSAGVPVVSINVAAFDNKSAEIVLAGASGILELTGNATLLRTVKVPRENSSIIDLLGADINGDGVKEIIASYVEPAVSGIYVLDKEGKFMWEYRVPSKNVLGAFHINIDTDEAREIIVVSQTGIFFLNPQGKLVRSTRLNDDAQRAYVADLGDNPYADFITAADEGITVYEVNENLIKAQSAEKYYLAAENNYRLANYQAAVANITAAKSLYQELGDVDAVWKCDVLADRIEQELKKIKKETAESFYDKGESQYYYRKYDSAKDYYQKARDIFMQIDDSTGAAKCDARIAETDAILYAQQTSSTTGPGGQAPATPPTGPAQSISNPVIALSAILAAALLAYALAMRRKMKNADEKKEPGKD